MRLPRLPGCAEASAARRFAGDRQAATAVEFALLAPAFFLILLFIVQAGTAVVARQVLELAVSKVERQIQMAPATRVAVPVGTLQTAVCNASFGIFRCAGLTVRLTPWSDAGMYCPTRPCVARTLDPYSLGFYGDIMRLEVSYNWPMYLPLAEVFGPTLPGSMLLEEIRVFRKEPPQP